ncbi:MAG: hypothetical protein WCB05_09255, partial [Candidatus Sulfotelmatobacter sp.]
MRQTAGHGKRADIDEYLDPVRLQRRDQLIQWARGMSDGVKVRQQPFDATRRLSDAMERGRDHRFFAWKNGPQVQ